MTGEELRKRLKTIEIDGKKISQKIIAERLGMSQPNLQKRFLVQDVGIGFIMSICDSLDISLSYFLGMENNHSVNENNAEYGNKAGKVAKLQAELAEARQIIYDLNLEILRLKTK